MTNFSDQPGAGQPSAQDKIDSPGNGACDGNTPQTVFVISDDAVWARLVAKNLAARGLDVRRCLPEDSSSFTLENGNGGWLIVDTGEQTSEFREFVNGVKQVLRKASVKTLAVVDSMAGHAQLVDMDADAVVSRTADMRVLVRKLLHAFSATPVERAVASVQSDW